MVLRKIVTIGTVALVIFVSFPALAESTNSQTANPRKMHMGALRPPMKPAVVGSVLSISGTSITLSGRVAPGNNATTTFNVDASNAKVFKNRATSTVSSITTGDMLFVQGTVTRIVRVFR
ncbi:MAG: hypothetical protein WCO16_02645 [bacterium]